MSVKPLSTQDGFYVITEKETPQKDLTVVGARVFDTMITDQGPTVSDFCSKGLKVVLFFMRSLACPFCSGTLEDIYTIRDTLYKLNTVVVVMYQEKTSLYNEFIKEFPKFSLLYCMPQAPWKQYFCITSLTFLEKLYLPNLIEGMSKKSLLKSKGIAGWKRSLMEGKLQDILQLAAIFLVHNNKIISECRKENGSERFDLARIVIDPDRFGIEVHCSVFQCERPKSELTKKSEQIQLRQSYLKDVSKSVSCFVPATEEEVTVRKDYTLKEILENPYYRGYLKLLMTKEYNVENLLFWEEVEIYKLCSDEDRKKMAVLIYDGFLKEDSEFELNVNRTMAGVVLDNIETASSDLFGECQFEIVRCGIAQSFSRLMESELLIQMQRKNKTKRSLMIGY